mmetsp:Transcript_53711/g.165250  ORF Transcript_53711/g.165250 Transcript_53711/m.165250 type:complete len:268 (+) Transcript_53711:1260-2063(+)
MMMRAPPSRSHPPDVGGLALALALESFNLVAMTRDCTALEATDISQALLGLCVGDRSAPSRWVDVIDAYGTLVKSAGVRRLLAAVPQDPRSEAFANADVCVSMQTALRPESDVPGCFHNEAQMLRDFVAFVTSVPAAALHDEGLWEMHTRLQKIITAWAFAEWHTLMAREGRQQGALPSTLQNALQCLMVDRDSPVAALATAAAALQSRMEDFRVSDSVRRIYERHCARAEKCRVALDIFRFVPDALRPWVETRGSVPAAPSEDASQ